MKTRSPQMTGVEFPGAGSATFHFTFFVRSHSRGRFFSADTPRAVGPRHAGQSSAVARTGPPRNVRSTRKRLMAGGVPGGGGFFSPLFPPLRPPAGGPRKKPPPPERGGG